MLHTEEIIVAGGCFWGVEHLFKQLPGVVKTEVGYIGGQLDNPSYEDVCTNQTGHYEAVRVVFNPKEISLKDILKYFFEIHDPTQTDGQGPDLGSQYLSAIFYVDDQQRHVAENVIHQLKSLGFSVTTKLLPLTMFWAAETYHQNYYQKTGKQPYCHSRVKRFPDFLP